MAKEWGKVETVTDFIFFSSKSTADGDCSHEMKRRFGRKAMTNLDSILKSTDNTLPTKVLIVKAMVFPVVLYESRIGLSTEELMLKSCGAGENF